MPARSLEIHPEALEELKAALVWYSERSETAAHNLVEEVDRAIALLTASPDRWPSGKHGTRRFVLRRFPFAIIYRVTESAVQLLAIAHGHRRPGYWKARR